MTGIGKLLIFTGLLLIIIGLLLTCSPRLFSWFGKLPGDISYKKDNFSFYMPLTTSLIISALASFILWLLRK